MNAPRFQFVTDSLWIRSIGAHFTLGIDGLSFLLVMLTTVLGPIAILSSWSAIQKREKEYYILLLLLQTGMLGVFMSLDFVLFYVFWEVMLVPMYFLIAVWGSERRLYAAIKFFLYTLAGSVLMLLAILAIYYYRGTFDIREILIHPFTAQYGWLQKWLFWGFFFAFAIKVPMFPFHTWLPDAHTEAPHGRFGNPGRRPVENGYLRIPAIFRAHVSGRDGEIPLDYHRAVLDRHHVRRSRLHDAEKT
jgi:NADH-quinone oxidoreductase subunit M